MDDMRQKAIEAMGEADDSLSERFRAAAYSYFYALKEHPAAGRLILFEMEGVSTPVDAHYANELGKSTQLMIDWFLSAATKRRKNPLRVELVAQGIIGALYQMAKEWMRSGFRIPADVMARHMQMIAVGTYAAYCGRLEI
jgi:hypothetical protein